MNIGPLYLRLSDRDFRDKIAIAKQIIACCGLCPRDCRVDRIRGEVGFCRTMAQAQVAHFQKHFGEEPPLSGDGGAGTIFFSYCNLRCVFCQNYQISQPSGAQKSYSPQELAQMMLDLQRQGSQNIDLVSPTPFVPMILEAVYLARAKGLNLPLVYNCNGYESEPALAVLEGVIDIYLPDLKYGEESAGNIYSQAAGYAAAAKKAVKLMHAQVGDLKLDSRGRARGGLIVRHLVLPNDIAASRQVLSFLKQEIGTKIGLSIMSQYAPCHEARNFPAINRTLLPAEYDPVVEYARELEFENCWIQEMQSNTVYFPDFDGERVFEKREGL